MKYALVSGVVYVRPGHPGATPPTGAIHHDTVRLGDDRKREINIYCKVSEIERAIIKLITEAIDESYLKTLIDRTTNIIITPVPDILDFLFPRYGVVEDEGHRSKEEEVHNMIYGILDPIVTILMKSTTWRN